MNEQNTGIETARETALVPYIHRSSYNKKAARHLIGYDEIRSPILFMNRASFVQFILSSGIQEPNNFMDFWFHQKPYLALLPITEQPISLSDVNTFVAPPRNTEARRYDFLQYYPLIIVTTLLGNNQDLFILLLLMLAEQYLVLPVMESIKGQFVPNQNDLKPDDLLDNSLLELHPYDYSENSMRLDALENGLEYSPYTFSSMAKAWGERVLDYSIEKMEEGIDFIINDLPDEPAIPAVEHYSTLVYQHTRHKDAFLVESRVKSNGLFMRQFKKSETAKKNDDSVRVEDPVVSATVPTVTDPTVTDPTVTDPTVPSSTALPVDPKLTIIQKLKDALEQVNSLAPSHRADIQSTVEKALILLGNLELNYSRKNLDHMKKLIQDAIAEIEVEYTPESGLWNSVIMPLLNGIIAGLVELGKWLSIYQPDYDYSPLLFKPVMKHEAAQRYFDLDVRATVNSLHETDTFEEAAMPSCPI